MNNIHIKCWGLEPEGKSPPSQLPRESEFCYEAIFLIINLFSITKCCSNILPPDTVEKHQQHEEDTCFSLSWDLPWGTIWWGQSLIYYRETTVRHLLDHEDKTWTTLRCVSHYLTGSILFYRYQENKNMNYIWMRHSIKLKETEKVARQLFNQATFGLSRDAFHGFS